MRDPVAPAEKSGIAWSTVVLAAVLMLATLPGRTQGLGLITEPLLADMGLDRMSYAAINLWATLAGACFCLPAGFLLDRCGLRQPAADMALLLGSVVWMMSRLPGQAGLPLLIFLTRAVGQSALSVASITAAGKSGGSRPGMAMAVYSVLMSIFFAAAFVGVGAMVSASGWRTAWAVVGGALVFGVAPLTIFFLRDPGGRRMVPHEPKKQGGIPLSQALRTPAFWIFGGAVALFGLVSSGLGLFNESVLAERGFDQKTYHLFLAVTTMVALAGQFLSGWLSQRWSLARLTGIAMFLYAAGIALLPVVSTMPQLWALAFLMGLSAGMIMVIFFAVWGQLYGPAHLGHIQGAAQMLAVVASAIGPLLFAWCQERYASFSPLLYTLAPLVLLFGLAAWRSKMKPFSPTPAC